MAITAPARAEMSQEETEHAKSALMFAERKSWSDARQHAQETHDGAFSVLIDWLYYLDADSGAGFGEISNFINVHQGFPEQKRLRIRAEQSIKDSGASDNDIIAWFGDITPITGAGKIALAEALDRQQLSSPDIARTLVKDAWINGDFDSIEADRIGAKYDKMLTTEDHVARTDRLLWEEKTSGAEDMLGKLPVAQKQLAQARIAFIKEKKNAPQLVSHVAPSLKNNPGLLYERMRFYAKKGDDKHVREMLLAAPNVVPYPEKWWRIREYQIRKAIDERSFAIAEKLLANHSQTDGQQLAEALWLQGWLKLEFLDQPKNAYDIFYRMFSDVRYPVSKARAAFWAGRAAEKAGDHSAANHWYTTGSAYPTTFYGQLSAIKISGTAPLRLPSEPSIGPFAQQSFDSSEIARAIAHAAALGKDDLASRLISGLMEMAKDDDQAAMIAGIGREIGQPYLSVRGAKKALQKYNVLLLKAGYPSPKTPYELVVERPLALAITRQESEFDPTARSPSGALGMMQLLPSTAKETARKNDLGYTLSKLYEPDYNWTLGSMYLNRMIDNYDGSYVMAIASYNAGPGNVQKWVKQFGTPGNQIDSAINWIEKIPFSETRNYVQRVLENLQMYRHILDDGDAPNLKLAEDLVR